VANETATLPIPTAPIADKNGVVTQVWWFFFQRLFVRTGQGTGGNFGTPLPLAPLASPFAYAPSTSGYLLVSGGGVYRMRISRQGGSPYPTGSFYGSFALQPGDEIIIEYVAAPTLTFFPG
jgi:hypothetical protein